MRKKMAISSSSFLNEEDLYQLEYNEIRGKLF